ncbi:DUF4129 domain-containing protein [Micromonospora sp. Llam7]|uniref:DUF4129 domain-containing protein n=1 Tax=Micromonospora tarapacensis TaxID=2835305 RepID=UPI001C82AB29|nr:DUF4129 domain-containing protein [Micromonospora tarapacensis]MBX7268997.1 DUF4129 domain-containing protein [Micromonospora tarapacensis]
MSFSRWWTETTAELGDHVPLPVALLLLVLATVLAASGWYTFPAWLPHRPPRRRPAGPARPAPVPSTPPTVRDPQPAPMPAATRSVADRLAAEGRYAEAIRERLRAMLHDLAERHLVRLQPGMTVSEVVAVAAANRPPTGPSLAAAASIFSEVWYAQRPATAEHDRRMRDHAARMRQLLAGGPADRHGPPATTSGPSAAAGNEPPGPAHGPAPAVGDGPPGVSGTVLP